MLSRQRLKETVVPTVSELGPYSTQSDAMPALTSNLYLTSKNSAAALELEKTVLPDFDSTSGHDTDVSEYISQILKKEAEKHNEEISPNMESPISLPVFSTASSNEDLSERSMMVQPLAKAGLSSCLDSVSLTIGDITFVHNRSSSNIRNKSLAGRNIQNL